VTIKNFQEAEAALLPYVPLVRQLTGQDTTLDRIQPLMELLGNPQNKLKVIHIAGTSGKTSTAYYMAALLQAGGKKVGLTVSPHVDSITERVQLNGQPLAEALFCEELGIFLDIIQQLSVPPSYFELLCAFAIWFFERQQVDYAVIETGLGGLHDATNVISRPDKTCVITDIGFDHTDVLGKSLAEIAGQKIGIVHDRNNVFMYRQDKEVMQVVEQWTMSHHAKLHVLSEAKEQLPYQESLSSMPDYQRRNWLLAHSVYTYLQQRDGLKHLTSQALHKTQHLQIPGRMDIRQFDGKTIVMDGAHNTQKMAAFVNSFRHLYPGVKPAILLALKDGKEYQTLVPILTMFATRLIVTTFKTSQDLPIQSMNADKLAKKFSIAGTVPVASVHDQRQAFQALMSGPEKVVIVTGSFYLLGQIRNNEGLS
jgi:dihydrofolate synthase/folylpolyglutamate synthase